MARGATVAGLAWAMAAMVVPPGTAAADDPPDDGARALTQALRSGTTDAASWATVVRWVLTAKEETVAAGFAEALRAVAAPPRAASPAPAGTGDDGEARWDATSRAVLGLFEDVLDDAQRHRRRDGDALAHGLVAVAGPAVIAALQESDPTALQGAAAAVRALAPAASDIARPLGQALHDPDASIRLGAATLLGALGPSARAAKHDLEKARKDRDPRVRDAARAALSQIEPR